MTTALLTERQLARWYGGNKHSGAERDQHRKAVWQRLRERYGDTEDLRQAEIDLEILEGEWILHTEQQVLLAAGTLCLRHGEGADGLWSAIWHAVHEGVAYVDDEEWDFLEDATRKARAGEL